MIHLSSTEIMLIGPVWRQHDIEPISCLIIRESVIVLTCAVLILRICGPQLSLLLLSRAIGWGIWEPAANHSLAGGYIKAEELHYSGRDSGFSPWLFCLMLSG